jgi:hypothetical protein
MSSYLKGRGFGSLLSRWATNLAYRGLEPWVPGPTGPPPFPWATNLA